MALQIISKYFSGKYVRSYFLTAHLNTPKVLSHGMKLWPRIGQYWLLDSKRPLMAKVNMNVLIAWLQFFPPHGSLNTWRRLIFCGINGQHSNAQMSKTTCPLLCSTFLICVKYSGYFSVHLYWIHNTTAFVDRAYLARAWRERVCI